MDLFTLTAIVVDEAAMVNTPKLNKLLEEAHEAGTTVVMSGHLKQLQAIGAGGGFAYCMKRLGGPELTEVRRQKNQGDIELLKKYLEGDIGNTLKQLDIQVEKTPQEAMNALVQDWKSKELDQDPRESIILVETRSDVAEVNQRIQRVRRKAGYLGKPLYQIGKTKIFYQNERIVFLKNDYILGVRNGEVGTLIGCKQGQLIVLLDNKNIIQLNPYSYPHFDVGYANTTFKGQGCTAERSYILSGEMAHYELFYVQISRHRESLKIYTSSQVHGMGVDNEHFEHHHEQEKVLSHDEVLAKLSQKIEQSRQKVFAHELTYEYKR